MIKDFEILSKIGQGTYSSVYKVRRAQDHTLYALKKIKLTELNDKEKQNALNEIRILASLRDPNIIAYKEAFLTETTCQLCLVVEYMNAGDLLQRIQHMKSERSYFQETQIWDCMVAILQGLNTLHSQSILHRDVKSANIFLQEHKEKLCFKLGDLNVSKKAKQGLLSTQTGTPFYASPEVWSDQPYDSKSDIWSLGCVIYEMVTLNPPFWDPNLDLLNKKIQKGVYAAIPKGYSKDLSDFIALLLQTSPSQRLSAGQLLKTKPMLQRLSKTQHTPQTVELLKTIRVPYNLHFLSEKLPAPNYMKKKQRKIDQDWTDPHLPKIRKTQPEDTPILFKSKSPYLNPVLKKYRFI